MSIGLMAARPPYVTFELMPVEDREASLSSGRYIAKDVEMVRITPAGSKELVLREARPWLDDILMKASKPQPEYDPAWAAHFKALYENWKAGNDLPAFGTPIKTWVVLSPAQSKNVISARVHTVEDLAVANEDTLRAIGMGARDLQAKARAWLEQASGSGVVVARMEAQEVRFAELERQLQAALETVSEQAAQIKALEPAKRGPGRPRTVTADDDDPVK